MSPGGRVLVNKSKWITCSPGGWVLVDKSWWMSPGGRVQADETWWISPGDESWWTSPGGRVLVDKSERMSPGGWVLVDESWWWVQWIWVVEPWMVDNNWCRLDFKQCMAWAVTWGSTWHFIHDQPSKVKNLQNEKALRFGDIIKACYSYM